MRGSGTRVSFYSEGDRPRNRARVAVSISGNLAPQIATVGVYWSFHVSKDNPSQRHIPYKAFVGPHVHPLQRTFDTCGSTLL